MAPCKDIKNCKQSNLNSETHGKLQKPELNGLVFAQHFTARDAKEHGVADCAGGSSDDHAKGSLRRRERARGRGDGGFEGTRKHL